MAKPKHSVIIKYLISECAAEEVIFHHIDKRSMMHIAKHVTTAISYVSEELHELRRMAEGNRRLRDVNTGLRAHFMPTTRGNKHIFEGFESFEDLLCFK
jgi:hypothetical protein